MRHLVIATPLVWLISGCAVGSSALRPISIDKLSPASTDAVVSPQIAIPPANPMQAKAVPLGAGPYADNTPACEVRLLAQQLASPKWQGIDEDKLGAFFVERMPATQNKQRPPEGNQGNVFGGVCIKRVGEPIKLPEGIMIATDRDGPDIGRFCQDEDRAKWFVLLSPVGSNLPPKSVLACNWNGTFHSSRPFTFTLMTGTGTAVADFVEAFRVYRNGDLMAAWNAAGDAPDPQRVVLDGKLMVTGAFAATLPPHMASMDLRVLPRQTGVTHEVDMEVRNDRDRFRTRLAAAGKASFNIALPPGTPARASLECVVAQIQAATATVQSVVDGTALVPLPPGCAPLVNAGGATPLSDAYKDIKNQKDAQLDSIRVKADAAVVVARAKALAAIPAGVQAQIPAILTWVRANAGLNAAELAALAAVQGCVTTFGQSKDADLKCVSDLRNLAPAGLAAKIKPLIDSLALIDEQITNLLLTADEMRLLAGNLQLRARDVLHDPNKQAEIFGAFTASLNEQESVFEPRRDNPPLMPTEQRLVMAYSDAWQGFMFAPWSAVPMQLSHHVEADLSGLTALPILDVVGARYQWARSRFADVRCAVGVGFIETEEPNSDKKRAAALPNVSCGLGTFKVGLGYAVGKRLGSDAEPVRILIGADLFKLISGSNVEGL